MLIDIKICVTSFHHASWNKSQIVTSLRLWTDKRSALSSAAYCNRNRVIGEVNVQTRLLRYLKQTILCAWIWLVPKAQGVSKYFFRRSKNDYSAYIETVNRVELFPGSATTLFLRESNSLYRNLAAIKRTFALVKQRNGMTLKGKFNSRDHTLAGARIDDSTTTRHWRIIMKDPRRAPAGQLSAWLSRSKASWRPRDEAPGGFCSTNALRD